VLHEQLSCDIEASFVKAKHLTAAGWDTDEQLLFVRPEAVKLWQKLESFEKAVHIEGPPGTGKSTIAWAWACYKAKTQSVLWVHRDPTGSGRVAQLSNAGVMSFPAKADSLEMHIDEATADVVIVDGITSKNDKLMGAALVWGEKEVELGRHVIIVSSSQFVLGEEHYKNHKMDAHSMSSWTLVHYKEACENEDFYQCIVHHLGEGETKEEQIANKFYIAGASARWMFAFSFNTIMQEVPKWVAKVTDLNLLLNGMNGERSDSAVNHLCMVTQKKAFIVCEYAMRLIAETCEASFIKAATRYASNFEFDNQTFDGWVFELDFMLQLRQASEAAKKSLVVYANENNAEKWDVGNRLSFDKPQEIESMKSLDDGTWLIPRRWNQGGYDAVQLLPDKRLRFVQITRGKTHGLKLSFFHTLIKHVVEKREVESVEVVFVVPRGAKHEFKCPTATNVSGSLEPWGWKLVDLRVVKLDRTS
jgi:hypothetical protein